MRSITKLKNLGNEKELCKIRIEGLEEQKELLLKIVKAPVGVKPINYSGLPCGKGSRYNLESICNEINDINRELEIEYAMMNNIDTTQQKYVERLKCCKGTSYEIGYMRIIEHKTYREIANELNLAEPYVRRIGAEILKED